MTVKQPLGKGLSALMGDIATISQAKPESNYYDSPVQLSELDLDRLEAGNYQPRYFFDEKALSELADSIKLNGVVQPIVVRPLSNGKYQIVAGERRWRASKQAGRKTIPAIVHSRLSDIDALQFALIENIQRQSLSPIEEAEGYKRLIEEFSYTQERLANDVGKSRSHVTNMLRLLSLPKEVKDMINSGVITMGHARALIGAKNPVELANMIVERGLSVREAERYAAGSGKLGRAMSNPRGYSNGAVINSDKDKDLLALENTLKENLGLNVVIESGNNGGRLTVYFNTLPELDKVLQKLSA